MKKVGLFVCSILTTCALMLASCGDGSNSQVPTTEAHQHVFSEWKTLADATCTEQGEQERVCACGETENETIPATGHTEGEWIIDAEATCTEDGSKHQVCSVCGAIIKTETIPATGHTEGEWITDVDATCTEDGSKHQVCSVCEETINTEILTKLGHVESDWIIDTLATCSDHGERHKYCATCGVNYDNENYYENHDYINALTTSYWYYSGDEKTTWSQSYPFIAKVCKNCNCGYWLGPTPTLAHKGTAYLHDGIHYYFEAKVADYSISGLKFRFIIADYGTALTAAARYVADNTPYTFDFDSGWVDSTQYKFDCLNFNPVASYQTPYLFVIAYDPATDTKQVYGSAINKENYSTYSSWYYYTIDLSFGSTP